MCPASGAKFGGFTVALYCASMFTGAPMVVAGESAGRSSVPGGGSTAGGAVGGALHHANGKVARAFPRSPQWKTRSVESAAFSVLTTMLVAAAMTYLISFCYKALGHRERRSVSPRKLANAQIGQHCGEEEEEEEEEEERRRRRREEEEEERRRRRREDIPLQADEIGPQDTAIRELAVALRQLGGEISDALRQRGFDPDGPIQRERVDELTAALRQFGAAAGAPEVADELADALSDAISDAIRQQSTDIAAVIRQQGDREHRRRRRRRGFQLELGGFQLNFNPPTSAQGILGALSGTATLIGAAMVGSAAAGHSHRLYYLGGGIMAAGVLSLLAMTEVKRVRSA